MSGDKIPALPQACGTGIWRFQFISRSTCPSEHVEQHGGWGRVDLHELNKKKCCHRNQGDMLFIFA